MKINLLCATCLGVVLCVALAISSIEGHQKGDTYTLELDQTESLTVCDINEAEFWLSYEKDCASFHNAYQTIKNDQFGISEVGELTLTASDVSEGQDIEFSEETISGFDVPETLLLDISDWNDFNYGVSAISFAGGDSGEVTFTWKSGKFDVIYDANNCTEAALTFIECMVPLFNETVGFWEDSEVKVFKMEGDVEGDDED